MILIRRKKININFAIEEIYINCDLKSILIVILFYHVDVNDI